MCSAVRVQSDGGGAVAASWQEIAQDVLAAMADRAEREVGRPVEAVGVRFLDPDGQDMSRTVGELTVVVGFRPARED